MKFNRNRKKSVKNIKDALTYLNLGQIDNKFNNFVNINYDFFFEQTEKPDIKFVNENGFELSKADNSRFSIEFVPNCISPKKIIVKLINLYGDSNQSYTVEYGENNVIKIIHRHNLKTIQYDMVEKLHNKYEESEYINSKLKYNKRIDNIVSTMNELSCTKETTTYYPHLDEEYVKSQISIGMTNSIYPTSVRCEKYNGEEVKSISLNEFNNIVRRKNINNKVLKLRKNL